MKGMLTIFPMFGGDDLAARVGSELGAGVGSLVHRRFPDGESYLRVTDDVAGRDTVFLALLHQPDAKFLPLLFAADAARSLGAASAGLIVPYLPYMRQDIRFNEGEAITSRTFSKLVSDAFDWIVTVDPHLHRIASLSEIYTIPAVCQTASDRIAAWARDHVDSPVIVGPDTESRQWIKPLADSIGVPHIILDKQRGGDREVRISMPRNLHLHGSTCVLVDDIASSGATMAEAVRLLLAAGSQPPVCVAVHGILSPGAEDAIMASGAACLVTTNSVPNPCSRIDIAPILAEGTAKVSPRTNR